MHGIRAAQKVRCVLPKEPHGFSLSLFNVYIEHISKSPYKRSPMNFIHNIHFVFPLPLRNEGDII